MDDTTAGRVARNWIAAWNSHDLDRILGHYTDDVVFTSPRITEFLGDPRGRVEGRDALRHYWATALAQLADLAFTPWSTCGPGSTPCTGPSSGRILPTMPRSPPATRSRPRRRSWRDRSARGRRGRAGAGCRGRRSGARRSRHDRQPGAGRPGRGRKRVRVGRRPAAPADGGSLGRCPPLLKPATPVASSGAPGAIPAHASPSRWRRRAARSSSSRPPRPRTADR
jgi:SnoaL-like domain